MTKKLALTIIGISVFTGLLLGGFVNLVTDSPSEPKKYSFTAEQICEEMGYDLAYEFESTDDVISCGSWSNPNMSDSKVNLDLLFKYAGENQEKFNQDYEVRYD